MYARKQYFRNGIFGTESLVNVISGQIDISTLGILELLVRRVSRAMRMKGGRRAI